MLQYVTFGSSLSLATNLPTRIKAGISARQICSLFCQSLNILCMNGGSRDWVVCTGREQDVRYKLRRGAGAGRGVWLRAPFEQAPFPTLPSFVFLFVRLNIHSAAQVLAQYQHSAIFVFYDSPSSSLHQLIIRRGTTNIGTAPSPLN